NVVRMDLDNQFRVCSAPRAVVDDVTHMRSIGITLLLLEPLNARRTTGSHGGNIAGLSLLKQPRNERVTPCLILRPVERLNLLGVLRPIVARLPVANLPIGDPDNITRPSHAYPFIMKFKTIPTMPVMRAAGRPYFQASNALMRFSWSAFTFLSL